ncbi:SDR family oxidoreductase [Bailinhaonella thermotolerans]|uniref:NAD-dependent epimerase/dehydratase family protein n=1 Tax=Bailinhaonella thermotolerans TaxID=1070861 RepID=A0A3A4A6G5_9ACTN|nr:NAD(P)H-binding protein [Bailinhaonella thermotolerans]RJL24165.1 NAD-dependent epimerase/dehydratase family protein [Bailinhaonella thermotolerans]
MKVLVTGATGRLGSAVTPRLAAAGHEVRAMSRRARASADGVEWVAADLATGEGVAEAVSGVDAVLHLASAPYRRGYTDRVELDGTRRLAAAAREAGAGHLVYVSIIGVDRIPWGYFRSKLRAEEIVRRSGVPWSIVRAAQFHEFVERAIAAMARARVLVVDPGISGRPVDVRDVAALLERRLGTGPTGRVEDFGGPEKLSLDELARQWTRARGRRLPLLRVRVPGRLGRAFRQGLAGDGGPGGEHRGEITWRRYLEGA